jgi:hypothetical protein
MGSGVMDHTRDQPDASHDIDRNTAFGPLDRHDRRCDAFPRGTTGPRQFVNAW